MRHTELPNKTDRFSKFKKSIDKILLQINTLSKTDKAKALSYVYENLQTQSSCGNKEPSTSRRKTKLTLRTDELQIVKKNRLKPKLKCPVCDEEKDTKLSLLKHLERFHVGEPLSCLRCRKTFNSQESYHWHVSNLCGRKKRTFIKRFKCPQCSKQFSCKRYLLLHQAGHRSNNCPHCNTVLTRRSELIRHLLLRHNVKLERNNFICDYCKKCFIQRRSLYGHLQSHLTSEFVCMECGHISKCEADHKNHEREHAKQKPWKCPHCKKRFARRHLYFAHLNRHERYKCVTCKESLASKAQIYQHKAKGHTVEGLGPQLSCPYCHLTFFRTKLLQKHLSVHEETTKEIPCKDCNEVLSSNDQYLRHCLESSHSYVTEETEAYICEYCGQRYTKKYLLDQHLVRTHCKDRGPYSCAHCDYSSKFKPNISRHLRLHFTQENQFVCDHCGKFFSDRSVLNDHINYAHKQVKQFKCTICDKSFKRKTELTRHYSAHSDSRPYNCVLCSNTYKRISHLRRHEKNIHGIANKSNKIQRLRLTAEGEGEQTLPNINKEPSDVAPKNTVPVVHFDITDLVLPAELPVDNSGFFSDNVSRELSVSNIEIIELVEGLAPISNLTMEQDSVGVIDINGLN